MCGGLVITPEGIGKSPACISTSVSGVAASSTVFERNLIEYVAKELAAFEIFDEVKYSKELKIIKLKFKGKKIYIFNTGKITVSGANSKEEVEMIIKLVGSLSFVSMPRPAVCCIGTGDPREFEKRLEEIGSVYDKIVSAPENRLKSLEGMLI